MKSLWKKIGTVGFWACWPLFRLYPGWGTRTRILVVCGDNIVVVRGWLATNTWKLPGGGLHRNELSLHGAIRELSEETGISVNAEQVQPLFSGVYHDNGLRTECECFLVELPDPVMLRGQRFEITEATWLPISKITSANVGKDVTEAVGVWQGMV